MQAEVLIEYKVKVLDKAFNYNIPNNMENIIKVGMKVKVPFGLGNKLINGFVIGINNELKDPSLKSIDSITDLHLILNDELLKLGKYMKETYLCTLISAYQAMLPSSLKIKTITSNYQKYDEYIKLKVDKELAKTLINDLKGKKQIELINRLINFEAIKKSEYSKSTIDSLINQGFIEIEKIKKYRINKEYMKKDFKFELNSDQKTVFDKITSKFGRNEIFLVHGVTGSGKTEVYKQIIEKALKQGLGAIMLVPEITLTAQIVNDFYERFGSDVAVLHSGLSDGEKYDEYLKIYKGDAKVVVGTRSAIFAPVKNLGIIIIDEEHSESYKQENNPRYNAIDIASIRAKENGIPLVLGSATPRYETFARSMKGVYTYLSLPKRINNFKLPKIEIVDMTSEVKKGNRILSEKLQSAIKTRLDKDEQVMLLLNRRGFSTLVTCSMCGFTFKCPNCDITLTFHKSSNLLRCHYCGHFINKPSKCTECGGDLNTLGVGTQKLEEELTKTFENAKIIRMDADTTRKKGAHEKFIKAFKEKKYNIMLGTQMISKGLDFKDVSLVGVINADNSLNIPDFRSGERTYSILEQTSGRAGRGGLDSLVLIQTYNKDNFTLKMLEKGSYIMNYKYEMAIRKKLKYPPYYFLIGIKVCSVDYELASKEANKIYKYIRPKVDKDTIILGPTTAGIFRLQKIYRFQMVIKYRFDKNVKKILNEVNSFYVDNKDVFIEVDIDPYYI